MDASCPGLSVITPVLNGGSFFVDCLESVAQVARAVPGAVEHIIADGGSTDGSLEIARSALEQAGSPVSRVLEGPDRGQSHAINRGAAVARGRWLAWLNADDVYVDAAERLVGELAAGVHDAADVIVGRCRFVDRSGRVVFAPAPPDLSTADDMLRPLTRWFAGRCIVQPEAFIRRELFEREGGLDEANHLAMDHDLWLRLSRRGAAYATIDALVAHQRVHDGQKTVDNLGVARQIVANCRRYFAATGDDFRGAAREVTRLSARVDAVDAVLRSRRRDAPFSSQAGAGSLIRALQSIRRPSDPVLVVGAHGVGAVRAAGWAGASLTVSSSPIAVQRHFGVVVVNEAPAALGDGWFERAWQSVRPGGSLVLGPHCAVNDGEHVRACIRQALGDRVTLRGEPWSPELLAVASRMAGWVAGGWSVRRAGASHPTPAGRYPVALAQGDQIMLGALGVDPDEIAETVVFRRGVAGNAR